MIFSKEEVEALVLLVKQDKARVVLPAPTEYLVEWTEVKAMFEARGVSAYGSASLFSNQPVLVFEPKDWQEWIR